MAGLLARPSPCDWLALRCIHCPHSRYHCQPTVIGSDGSAQKNIQILAFIICYTLARPDLFDYQSIFLCDLTLISFDLQTSCVFQIIVSSHLDYYFEFDGFYVFFNSIVSEISSEWQDGHWQSHYGSSAGLRQLLAESH